MITHPFHPERGQRFQVVNTRRAGGIDCLVLRRSAGVFWTVPGDWTDRARPRGTTASCRLEFDGLIELAELIEGLSANVGGLDG